MSARIGSLLIASGAALVHAVPPCAFEVRAEFPALPPNMERGVLWDVEAAAPDDIWIAGYSFDQGDGPDNPAGTYTLAYHWDGSSWSHVGTPNPNDSTQNALVDLSLLPDGSPVGVGAWTSFGGNPLVIEWDGSQWLHVPAPGMSAPHTPGFGPYAVWSDQAGDSWIAGAWGYDATVMRWSGGSDFTWQHYPRVNTGVHHMVGIHGSSPSNIWAVGGAGGFSGTGRVLVWHYNGSSWVANPPPHLGGVEYLSEVFTFGPNDTWVAGVREHVVDFTNTYDPLVWHWDGSTWTQVPCPDFVASFAAFGPDDIYASGQLGNLLHWDGAAWTEILDASDMLGYSVRLNSLAAVGPCELVGAGVWAQDIFTPGTSVIVRFEMGDTPCPADLSGSSDPNDPAYGTPDGILDSSDFFYYLDQFVAGNLAVGDLTGSSDPNDPAYGTPDGLIDAADFFYFLDVFVRGC